MYSPSHAVPRKLSSELFAQEVKKRIANIEANNQPVTLVALDFDNFNYINDLYGFEIGDLVLGRISERFGALLSADDIFSRQHADHYLLCLQTGDTARASRLFMELTDLKQDLEGILPPHYTLFASGGILTVNNSDLAPSALFDQANCARKLSKGAAGNTFRIYDEKIKDDTEWKKQVTCMMEVALQNSEFEMYLQPKVFLKTGEIVGAEALVRWNSPDYGFIYPDRFIPILEQNGFIQQLDFFMLGEACRFLNENKKNGVPQLPISINFSRSHLRTDKLVERIFETVNQQGVATHLIEIEFTENLLSESVQRLIEIVSNLKLLGFRVSIDDFGSAYSSLNYLKDLPIDIVKIDKGFLDASTDTDRGKIIIAKVVELIKSLRMVSVMEGVEEKEQVDFLQKLSCDIAQGYFYAKPMPQNNYLEYLKNGSIIEDLQARLDSINNEEDSKSYLYVVPQEFQMDNWELYTLGKNIDMGLMKGYLDGEATIQYVNDRALEYLGYTRQEFREVFNNSMAAFTHPDDAHIIQKNTEELTASGKPLSFTTRAIRKDGKIIVLQGRASCTIDNHGRPVGIYAVQDVTEELENRAALQAEIESKITELEEKVASEQLAREALRISEEKYRVIIEQGNNIIFEWDFESDAMVFSGKYVNLFGYEPLGVDISSNPLIRELIHPDDLDIFEKWIADTYRKSGLVEASYRIMTKQGDYLQTACRSTALCDQKGVPLRAVGVFADVHR